MNLSAFRAALLISGNADGAKKALTEVQSKTDAAGKVIADTGAKTRKADGDTGKLAAAHRTAATAATAQAAAERTNAQATVAMGNANRVAAGQVGNLTAQFNDIGVILAAGQNPLQLALQQGTQISQVIGPMGAAGAVRSLGAAFLGLVNPVSLVTIGTIGLGAAAFQWFTQAEEAAEESEDALETMEQAAQAYISAMERANASAKELREEFGAMAADARANLEEMATLQARAFDQATRQNIASVVPARRDNGRYDNDDAKALADTLGMRSGAAGDLPEEFERLLSAFRALEASADGTRQQQVVAYRQVSEAYETAAQYSGDINAQELETLTTLRTRLGLLIEVTAAENEVSEAAARQAAAMQGAYASYGKSRADSEAQLMIAYEMEGALRGQAEIQELIAQYGADSRQVAEATAAAEARAFAQKVDALDVSDDLKNSILDAYDRAEALSQLNIAGGIWEAANAAAILAANLAAAAAITPAMRDEDAVMSQDVGDFDASDRERQRQAVETYDRLIAPKATRGGGRGGGGRSGGGGGRGGGAAREAERERQAVQDLIGSLKEELDILRETDPVKQEMIRQREVLTAATAAERAGIEELIRTREREATAAEAAREASEFWREGAADLIKGAAGVDGLSEAFDRLKGKIADAAFEAALFGTGPLASLFGGGGLGGGLLGAILPKKSRGGMIHGPGSGTSDDVLMYGSSGEYVVNARATAANRTLLDAINSGGSGIPGFSRGGQVGAGGSGSSPASRSPDRGGSITIDVKGARGDRELQEMVRSGVQAALRDYDRDVLPLSWKRVENDKWRVG